MHRASGAPGKHKVGDAQPRTTRPPSSLFSAQFAPIAAQSTTLLSSIGSAHVMKRGPSHALSTPGCELQNVAALALLSPCKHCETSLHVCARTKHFVLSSSLPWSKSRSTHSLGSRTLGGSYGRAQLAMRAHIFST